MLQEVALHKRANRSIPGLSASLRFRHLPPHPTTLISQPSHVSV